MGGRRGLVAALVATAAWAPPAAAERVEPVTGTVRIGPAAADPVDQGLWSVRSWRVARVPRGVSDPGRFRERIRCAQVGRRDGAMLVRTVRGATRVLGWRDRTGCGSVEPRSESPPLLVERLVDAPAAPPARTLVAGVLRRGDRGVRLELGGVARDLPLAHRSFLAVLPGSVRRADITLAIAGRARTRRLELGRTDGYGTLVAGSLRRALTVPALDGGPDVAVTTFAIDQPSGFPRMTCLEVGRAIGTEAGQYDPGWGVFLDAPTVADLSDFEDGVPSVKDPRSWGGCAYGSDEEAFVGPRLGPTTAGFAIILPPGPSALALTDPAGAPVPRSPLAGVPRGFFAQFPSTGALGEFARAEFTGADGRTRRGRLWLGRHDAAGRFARYRLRGRRTVRIRWSGYDFPIGPVAVEEAGRSVRIRVTNRLPPTFDREGYLIGRDDESRGFCVDVRLRRPLGGRRVVDAASGRTARRAGRSGAAGYAAGCRPITAPAEPQVATASGRSASATPARSG